MLFKNNEQILERYQIEDFLGKGGFGEVYLARHLELNVFRAIKVLHKNMPGITEDVYKKFQSRFKVEARFGAKLDNPNIIRVFDFTSENNTLFLIMEYAPCGNLDSFIKKHLDQNKLIPADDALRIIRDVAAGLVSIHELGGVHRDLKPANILFDQNQHAKIADLGIVQISDNGPQKLTETRLGHPGTPAYMSPEQRTSASALTPASDIYALGLIAFEIFTLRMKQTLPEKIKIAQFRSDIEPWLDNAICDMLDLNPKKRPYNGQEVLEILNPSNTRKAQTKADESYVEIPLPYGCEMQMLKVPMGQFIMGADDPRLFLTISASPMHKITLSDYWIGRSPVNVSQFASFVRRTGYVTVAEREGEGYVHDRTTHKFIKVRGATWAAPYGPDKVTYLDPNRPVTMISWIDAQAYCQWLSSITGISFRLPSEAEWEKAARGTDGRFWAWGNRSPNRSLCNFRLMEQDLTPSDYYSPGSDSPYGCMDMMGNIWEWTSSLASDYPYNPNDGRELPTPGGLRILRGGSNIHYPSTVVRDKDPENACYYNDGFRVAASGISKNGEKNV